MDGRSLRVGVVWNLVPIALLAGVGLGLNFAVGRLWGSSALGVFNQVSATYFVISVFAAGGIHYSVLRSIAAHRDNRTEIAQVVVGGLLPAALLSTVVTLAFIAARHPFADWLDSPEIATGMLWAAPGLWCFTLNKVLLGVVNGHGRMRAFAVYTSLRYLLIAVGISVAWLWGFAPAQLPGIWTLTEGTLLLVLLAELAATVDLFRARGWRKWVGPHVNYGIRGAGSALLIEMNTRLDIWVLGAALSDAKVGIYSMAAIMAEGMAQLPIAVQVNVNPRMATYISTAQGSKVLDLARETRRWFVPLMIGACIAAAASYPFLIPWITQNPEFVASALPFALLVTGIAIASPWLPFNQVLLMGGHPGWHTIYMALVVTVNLGLNLLLIPHFELVGAGIATGIAFVFSAALLRFMAQRLLSLRL